MEGTAGARGGGGRPPRLATVSGEAGAIATGRVPEIETGGNIPSTALRLQRVVCILFYILKQG